MNGRGRPERMRLSLLRLCLFVIGVLLTFAAAQACNVPVFRYALEHWSGDSYRLLVFYRGQLTDAEQQLLKTLEADEQQPSTNVSLRRVNTEDIDDEADRKLFESESNPQLPRIVMQYPQHLKIEAPVWSAPLNSESVTSLLNSPVRDELIRRLKDGETAVWLLLECGERDKDEAAAQRLETELKKLQQELKLPELTDAPSDALLDGPPLRVEFSLLRVARTAEEAALVATLLHAEPDLAEESEPLVFPVFGRGRALLPLLGAGITAENIQTSASFLVGPCSCQVKEQNPGFDLLLSANWGFPTATETTETLASTNGSGTSPVAEFVPIPSGAPAAAAPSAATQASPAVSSKSILPLVFAVCLLSAIGLFVSLRVLRRRT